MGFGLCLCVFLFISAVLSQISEGEPCYTARNEYGICQNIRKCASMVRLLRISRQDPDIVNYITGSTCGYEGSDPRVCCPESNDVDNNQQNTTIDNSNSNNEVRYRINSKECGYSNVTNFRIVGGIPAKLHEIAFIVNLGYRDPKNPNAPKWLCGGSLITDRHVLTAAHCVVNRPLYVVRFGEWDLYNNSDGANPEDINVLKAEAHEGYNRAKLINDIAIVTVERPVTHPWVWPVCLPIDESMRSKSFAKWTATVAGWGAIYYNGPSSSILQIAQTPVVEFDKCKTAFAKHNISIDENVICAGRADGRQDACQGDSGGPLFWGTIKDDAIQFYQIGIVSYGFRCAEVGYPGVYTRVTKYIDWIQEKVK